VEAISQNPAIFSKFNLERRSATPPQVPEDAILQLLVDAPNNGS